MKKNISYILQGLEPSSELKRRVMEQASKLEAGRKTFGNEADNMHIQKENIKMNANNTYEVSKVKRSSMIIPISVAACAALVVGIAAVNRKAEEPKPLPMMVPDSIATDEQTVSEADNDNTAENVMTVTEQDGSTYTIEDKDRIAAIDALIEKAKTCHVWEGEKAPTARTLEYYINGEKKIVEISEDQICPDEYHQDADIHPEFCIIVTVDGTSYAVCEFIPDEPLSELKSATNKGGDMFFQRWNDDRYEDQHYFAEINDEDAARRLRDIIEDVNKNGTPQFETDYLVYWDQYEEIPDWETARVTCSFDLDGNYYDVDLFWDSDLIFTEVIDWHDGKTRYVLYKDTQNWISEFDEVFNMLDTEEAVSETSDEDSEAFDPQEEENAADEVELPELFDLTEEQAVAALNEAGLNCIIGYRFDSTEKGYVCSYYADPESDYVKKGSYIAVDISLGEYDGSVEMIKPEHATGYYPGKEVKLEVPVPEGLSGSYTFNIYVADDVEYTNTVDDIKDVKSVTFDIEGCDKSRQVIYVKNNNSKEEKLIRYATYEFDYEAETWNLIGELNTEGLLASMN